MATVGHVLSGTEAVRVKLASGEWRPARVAEVNPSLDVALLRIEGELGRPVTPAPAMPRQGQAIAAVGRTQRLGLFPVGRDREPLRRGLRDVPDAAHDADRRPCEWR